MNTEETINISIQIAVDLSSCEREPIHVAGTIQPNGVLLALNEADLTVMQASANCLPLLGLPADRLIGRVYENAVAPEQAARLTSILRSAALEETPLFLMTVQTAWTDKTLNAIAHRYAGQLILELETVADNAEPSHGGLYTETRAFILHLKAANTLDRIAALASEELRKLTGFDRVLIYKFDPDWNGHVIGESRDAGVASYLDLWFPASDIPPDARQLYELNRVRLISNADYTPVPVIPDINPITGKPLDMSYAVLRSVSPIHLENLKNMGVASSMSVSLLTADHRLWGLIAFHHRRPRHVSFMVRSMCDLIAQALSIQIEAYEQRSQYEERIRLKSITSTLLARMAQADDVLHGLTDHADEFLDFGQASGAVVFDDGICTCVGKCPAEDDVRRLVEWLATRGREDVFHTDCLPLLIPDGEAYREHASGVLAISTSQIHRSYLMWFRREAEQTVNWGGNPRKPALENGTGRGMLHPRRSFETWKQTVRNRSIPWTRAEVEAAVELRNAALGIVLRKAEELAQLSDELKRSNQELEAFSYSVSHDLRAPFRHIVGYSELLKDATQGRLDERELRYLEVIRQSAQYAGTLVDNLLSFSRVGRAKLNFEPVDMNRLVEAVRRDLATEYANRAVEWRIEPLGTAVADLMMMRLVWQNLIQNALKYTRGRTPATIEISWSSGEQEDEYAVTDNGVGFEQAYVNKLFGIFQRLHRVEEFEGTGIGLANVRRMIARHGGRTWAEGEVNRGARFFFTLPKRAVN
jgi:light-regulated signal transduction histidine kinase (bacteriophytochrome)